VGDVENRVDLVVLPWLHRGARGATAGQGQLCGVDRALSVGARSAGRAAAAQQVHVLVDVLGEQHFGAERRHGVAARRHEIAGIAVIIEDAG